MMPYISIIMPVYNAARYLGLALESILSQSYTNYELILLNDGSTDNSLMICREYQKRDSRIVFIDKRNEGVSITRNIALDIAQGDYVIFIDSDDVIYPNTLKDIFETISEYKPDLLRYEYQCIDEYGKVCFPNYLRKNRKRYSKCVMDSASFMKRVMLNEYFLCMHVFKRSILEKFNIRFLPGCTYNEDTLFIVQYMMNSKVNIYVPILFYGYRKYSGAVTSHFTEKNYKDVQCIFKELQQLYDNVNADMKHAIRIVIEQIGLVIYVNASTFYDFKEKDRISSFCAFSPVTMDWKIISIIGSSSYSYVLPIISIIKKIKRKLFYICGR